MKEKETNKSVFPLSLKILSKPTFFFHASQLLFYFIASYTLPLILCALPFPFLISLISTKPSSLSLVLSFCLNTLQSTHLGGCYWSSCILLPGNPFPLSQSVAVIAEGIRGGERDVGGEGGAGMRGRE